VSEIHRGAQLGLLTSAGRDFTGMPARAPRQARLPLGTKAIKTANNKTQLDNQSDISSYLTHTTPDSPRLISGGREVTGLWARAPRRQARPPLGQTAHIRGRGVSRLTPIASGAGHLRQITEHPLELITEFFTLGVPSSRRRRHSPSRVCRRPKSPSGRTDRPGRAPWTVELGFSSSCTISTRRSR